MLAIFIRLFNFFHGFYFIARWGEKGGEGLDSRNVFTFFPRVCAWFVCVIWGGGRLWTLTGPFNSLTVLE